MSASTGELVDSSKKGNQIAQQIEEKAKEIQQDVVKSQEKAMNIAGELDQRLKRSIERAQVVNEIANMANQIAGIADQTNLLANAALKQLELENRVGACGCSRGSSKISYGFRNGKNIQSHY